MPLPGLHAWCLVWSDLHSMSPHLRDQGKPSGPRCKHPIASGPINSTSSLQSQTLSQLYLPWPPAPSLRFANEMEIRCLMPGCASGLALSPSSMLACLLGCLTEWRPQHLLGRCTIRIINRRLPRALFDGYLHLLCHHIRPRHHSQACCGSSTGDRGHQSKLSQATY